LDVEFFGNHALSPGNFPSTDPNSFDAAFSLKWPDIKSTNAHNKTKISIAKVKIKMRSGTDEIALADQTNPPIVKARTKSATNTTIINELGLSRLGGSSGGIFRTLYSVRPSLFEVLSLPFLLETCLQHPECEVYHSLFFNYLPFINQRGFATERNLQAQTVCRFKDGLNLRFDNVATGEFDGNDLTTSYFFISAALRRS
jgi:hypothetical protein